MHSSAWDSRRGQQHGGEWQWHRLGHMEERMLCQETEGEVDGKICHTSK